MLEIESEIKSILNSLRKRARCDCCEREVFEDELTTVIVGGSKYRVCWICYNLYLKMPKLLPNLMD